MGVKFFIIQIAVLIYATTDKLVITHFLGPQYVTEYDLVYRLFALPGIITGTINTSLWSGYTDAFYRGDFAWIKKMITKLNLSVPLMFTATLLLVLFGLRIVEVWSSGKVQTTVVFLIFMGINVMLGYWNSIYSNILNGIGKVRLGTVTTVITAILNIYLSIAFGQCLGLKGVILATFITCLLSAIISPMQVYYWVYAKSKKRALNLLFS